MSVKKERILLKFSGGALKGKGEIYSEEKLIALASQVKELNKSYEIGIVIGGGNIWRGKEEKIDLLSAVQADYVGMMATIMNSYVFKETLESIGVKSRLYSALAVERIVEDYSLSKIEEDLSSGRVIIFGGGLGEPRFSTDSAAIMRGIEIGAKKILIGKDGVEGVYNKDPNIYEDAVFYGQLSYDRIISENIKVFDHSALNLAKENKLHFLIFNQEVENSFIKSLNGGIRVSEIF
ncbi:UMP kinase [Mycoplasma suis]|uniref:Uridylate kinase n=1 Tax=Mycoplasma suis (strain Illinois) TaxID=768700 RepID=F0QRB8_MYCSL|nr:UMP kinase [Mycoplasma suis]ADX98038.1 Uridylate kinase [Mycoplasma suis str. Illinois]